MAEISAALGIAITAFQGCVQALVLISQARGTPQDLEDAQLRTELLLNSLVTWAKAVGLTDDPPTLQMSLRDAQYVPRILKRLESLFSDLNELKRKYKVVIKSTEEEFESTDDGPAWMQYVNLSGYLKRTQPWKRLKWISIDKDKFKDLLDSAKEYIGELRAFLRDAPLEREQNFFELILRIEIINTRDEGRLSIMQQELQVPGKPAISTVARLKQTKVALGLSAATSLANQPTEMPEASLFGLLLDSSPVSTQVLKRVNQVAAFLQNMGPALHSLQCRGFVEDKNEDRYGYVFDLPAELDPSSPATQSSSSDSTAANSQPLCLETLRQVLGQFKLPSLNFRLRMAVILLENLLNLHTSGWLHKEFRSENILLIGPSNGFKDIGATDPSRLNAQSKTADASFNPVMSSLQSQMGKRYTRVVEQLLAAKDLSDHASTANPESALDFEMRVRNEIQSIAKAI
ncbi:hypothetical protein KC340_g4768 [Hortaea werneckii]|nr:hypothetical protein KC342_g11361 [Hortaea werneckii]KAI7101058.1 hypothetical protein KC339_g7014 [Hortaea werneckii]KAI7234611.1 hypothetical protein KC365_g5904 [Hortaea werneckii]KAI7329204.1 hypothetical protein KC340_g4768 [Hortaea werneckii]KAI7380808.1 hypothetical protein KC328_g12592 [Hortaea werneckii]